MFMAVDDDSCKKLAEQLREVGNELLQFPTQVDELLSLLDKVRSLLMEVEQAPTELIQNAHSQCMAALVADPLLRHTDADVQVAVASCIIEIMRITAPDVPYSDNQLKEVFQLIVSSFANLSDMSSRSYDKRVSILETFAKVSAGVIMLDLEFDELISEMFQHFLRSIRDCHPEDIFSYMETIMTLLLEQSEEVSVELLTPILASLERNNEEISTSARKLGESVLAKCAIKLESYLKIAVKLLGLPLDGYSEIVATICSEVNGVVEHNSGTISIQKEKREAVELVSKPSKNDQAADESDMPPTKRRRHLRIEDIQTEIEISVCGDNAPASDMKSQSQAQTSISKLTTKSENVDEQSLKLEESTGSIAGAFKKIWSILGSFRSQ
ncbi:hypothetical protein POM88_027782 [Heracleum sosnowskyi]|uniref:Sister chromatid cohesion protein n=1 Tax=Heracleum sosnowskyi TaxID=360622 RepID=A0AAD8I963_9APIA|nr:hypothetical protein POM88_027782 [Heracleum sosnowskyi]